MTRPEMQPTTSERAERVQAMDMAVLFLFALIVYSLFMLPGPGWGAAAALQTYALTFEAPSPELFKGYSVPAPPSAVYAVSAHAWSWIVSFGNPAWRITFFSAFLSAASLLFIFAAMRIFTTSRSAPTLAAAALAFSHSWFLHAVLPSVAALTTFFFSAQLFFAIRALMAKGIRDELAAHAAALATIVVSPDAAAAALLPALFLVAVRRCSPFVAFEVLLLVGIVVSTWFSGFSLNAYPMLAAFSLFEFPVAGWLLLLYGMLFLRRRFPSLLYMLSLAWIGSCPTRRGIDLLSLFSSMQTALPALAVVIGAGIVSLYERIAPRRELRSMLPPTLFAALVVFPLVTTALTAYLVRSSNMDKRLALDEGTGVTLRDNPWCDAAWYALWPMKNGEGGAAFIAEVEANVPEGSVLVADPEILPVLDYARRAESRLNHAIVLSADIDEQLPELMSASLKGQRIFLCGIDPRYYDAEALGSMGEIVAHGRLFEWRNKAE